MPKPTGELAETAREVGTLISGALPKGVGFALLIFDFGDKGSMNWISNAERSSMIKALQELIRNLQRGDN